MEHPNTAPKRPCGPWYKILSSFVELPLHTLLIVFRLMMESDTAAVDLGAHSRGFFSDGHHRLNLGASIQPIAGLLWVQSKRPLM